MTWLITATAPLLLILLNSSSSMIAQSHGSSNGIEVQHPGKSEGEARSIEFREFFEADVGELKPSAKMLGLNGRSVRMNGFMEHMETPNSGVLSLCHEAV